MEKLIAGTAAYAAFSGDVDSDRVSHSYMLHFQDAKNMRFALKIFALKFFGVKADDSDGRRITGETFPDLLIFPEEGKKFTADACARLLSESALRPLERDRKLFVISEFNEAAPLIQNKLLKTLEEPQSGVYFLLGATSVGSVLDTVKSRVKTLTVPPFSKRDILAALERKGANPLNKRAAECCGGIFGAAENMVSGGWFADVDAAAQAICTVRDAGTAGELAVKYGDTKYRTELLTAIGENYHAALVRRVNGEESGGLEIPALMYACDSADRALRDLKFNAFFQGLLYDLMLRVIKENDKWLKLRA